ncbi:hypothetical protein [Glaciihabitans sp. dw_435]|uniref:hypothetical protein n=1 Tax=Glaciihabitans sp. dw_435 TaxID=2720081 RepID=UPI001BD6DCC5|nr:hypothetical protein [Glaciihabitans sp. dw_435]
MSRYTRPARRSGWGRLTTRAVALVVAAVLAGATGVVGTSAAVAATPAAASPGTFTVVGTVQAEARTGVTVTPAVWDPDSEEWTAAATSVAVNATTGAFALKLPAGSSRYTILFETKRIPFLNTYLGGGTSAPEDDTLGKSVFSGAKGTTKTIAEVKLVPAGVIEGVITDVAGAPIVGGIVSGTPVDDDLDYPATTTTAANGSYYLPVKRNVPMYVSLSAEKYEDTYYPGTEDGNAATTLSTTSANSFHLTGVDLTVKGSRPSVVGAFGDLSDESLTQEQYDALPTAHVYIYPVVNGTVSSIPAQTSGDDVEFEFDGLNDGDYMMAFRDTTTNAWIPATSNTGAPKIGSAVSGNGCLVPLTLVRGHDVDLGVISLGATATTPCTAPWGTGAVFSGKVTNMTKGAATTAELFYATSVNDIVDVDIATVSATGTYSFSAITTAGRYFVLVTAGRDAPYFDTLQGGYSTSNDVAAQVVSHAPKVAANTASSGNDVTLIPAAIVTGKITGGGKPLEGAYALISQIDSADDGDSLTYDSTATDAAGRYLLKVRTGSNYAIAAEADDYSTQYFDGKATLDDATLVSFAKPGKDPRSFNFAMKPLSPTVSGIVVTFPLTANELPDSVAPVKNLSATLYRKIGGYYKKVATELAPAIEELGNSIQFPVAGAPALVAGDYHVRFSVGTRWIPMSQYATPATIDEPTNGPACFIPVKLGAATQELVYASLDLKDTKTKCADEPVKKPIVSTGSSASNPAVISWPADPAVIMAPSVTSTPTPTATPTPSVTPTVTAEPTDTAEPSETASEAPVASPQNTSVSGNLAWIYVVGGLILAAIIAALIIMVARRQAAAGK